MAEILKIVVESISVLAKMIRPSFGPQGIDIAMETQSGNIILTNSGNIILNSLSMSHPVCRLVSQQVDRHVGLTGDGSKEIVIVLSEFLKFMRENMPASIKLHDNSELRCVSQACGYTASIQVPKLNEILEPYCKYQTISYGNTENIRRIIKSITRSSIQGKVQEEALRILVDTTGDLVLAKQNLEQEKFLNYICNLIDEFKDVCITTSGMSVVNTKIINGFLIKQNSIGSSDSKKLGKPVKFVIIQDIFNEDTVDFGTIELNCNQSQLGSAFKQRVAIIHRFASFLESNSISVILCSHGVPDYAKTSLGRKFIIIQHVDEEDIKRVSTFFKIFPIEYMGEVFSTDFTWHSGDLLAIDQIQIGRECYVRLSPDFKQYENEYPSCQLILCSPHQSITQQYYSMILNMLKVIKMSFYHAYGSEQGNNYLMKYLPSATAVEIIIAEYFATEAHKETDTSLRNVYKSLSEALMEVPKLIYKNSNRTTSRFIDIQKLLQDARRKYENDCCFSCGIDSETGEVFEPYKQGIMEPFSSKLLLISHVLQAAQQILRIDSILPAKAIKGT